MSVKLQRIEPGSYGVHGHPHLLVLAKYVGWEVLDRTTRRALHHDATFAGCRQWLNEHLESPA